MARDLTDSEPLTSCAQLKTWLEAGCKSEDTFRVGTEHEKFPFCLASHAPIAYQFNSCQFEAKKGGDAAPQPTIRALLEGMQHSTSWQAILENGAPIGLYDPQSGGAISLEPAGQFELSGAPLRTIHETAAELTNHFAQLSAIANPLGIGFLGLGHCPTWTRDELPIMPKGRYEIMRAYMPQVGTRGLDMMLRTCTVQANLDFSSEADMVLKLRVMLALQPIITALFANSPFAEGKANGFISTRSEIWRDTDNQRAGMLPFAFEDGMGFERYVDYALDVPMYFIKRGETYHNVAGASFRDFMAGKLVQMPHEYPTISDWANHLSTIFPEVRLKRYLEMRGADMGSAAMVLALPALCVGLMYDAASLDQAWQLVRNWNASERQRLRDDVPRLGLKAVIQGRSVQDVARDVVALAEAGLKRRAFLHPHDKTDETVYLAPLHEIIACGKTQAEIWLDQYKNRWEMQTAPLFEAARIC
jgi:glutamate--cysteine ligase